MGLKNEILNIYFIKIYTNKILININVSLFKKFISVHVVTYN